MMANGPEKKDDSNVIPFKPAQPAEKIVQRTREEVVGTSFELTENDQEFLDKIHRLNERQVELAIQFGLIELSDVVYDRFGSPAIWGEDGELITISQLLIDKCC